MDYIFCNYLIKSIPLSHCVINWGKVQGIGGCLRYQSQWQNVNWVIVQVKFKWGTRGYQVVKTKDGVQTGDTGEKSKGKFDSKSLNLLGLGIHEELVKCQEAELWKELGIHELMVAQGEGVGDGNKYSVRWSKAILRSLYLKYQHSPDWCGSVVEY